MNLLTMTNTLQMYECTNIRKNIKKTRLTPYECMKVRTYGKTLTR